MAHGQNNSTPIAPRSRFHLGPFGRMFPMAEPWVPKDEDGNILEGKKLDDFFRKIADELMMEVPNKKPGEINTPEEIERLEGEFNSKIPAGYTYFGQFVDHDITFDPASELSRKNDPNGLANFRTPRLDLDNLYGRGPADQPYMYESLEDGGKFRIGKVSRHPDLPDLLRLGCTAVIGDKRNDENAMVSQLQLAFLLAHNTLVERAKSKLKLKGRDAFEAARKTLHWLYQYIVWNDYVPRIVIDEVHKDALKLVSETGGRKAWELGFANVYKWKNQPFMPVEFSVAAYRFGHSMVRNSYRTNKVRGSVLSESVAIFDSSKGKSGDDLRGFRPIKRKNCIQWDWFLPMQSSGGPFPQMARKIDTKLCNALSFLHESETDRRMNILAFRNLKRGWAFDIPKGTEIAKSLAVKPVNLKDGEPDMLWYYVLREAQANGGNTLGRVGSIVVASVFAGLLKGDPFSYFNMDPEWTPDNDPLLEPSDDNRDSEPNWQLASIIRIAGLKANGIGFEKKPSTPIS